ncbi:MAG: gamma-glutamyltransferase family protein [Saccharospirillum sp.]|uniref:gamma-glutamyltransferase family protein n=1 Tax=Saccharospirillum sp. TaxID=2033801 RepID=UPI0032978DEC
MIHTKRTLGGACVAPHHSAAQAGRDVLQEGGNAVEAMVAAAASIAVVYPHMNALGGDGFWLIKPANGTPIAIDACGPAGQAADIDFYTGAGETTIPSRGPHAALTVAGTIGGWQQALKVAHQLGGNTPVSRLLAPAEQQAREGIVVSQSQAALTRAKFDQLARQPGFAEVFLNNGQPPSEGDILYQPDLADTLAQLSRAGLDDFYRGDLAQTLSQGLEALGSPVRRADLEAFRARLVEPLHTQLRGSTVYNLPPPTQGLASLIILGLFDRLNITEGEGFDHLHGLIEATKAAFTVRDLECIDPDWLTDSPARWLTPEALNEQVKTLSMTRARPWPNPTKAGDTVWLGCIDKAGNAVSFIQSIYWEFGSGVVVPGTGVTWQNRGTSFSLDPASRNALSPGRRPFHTLNPALAEFDDGRTMVYGTMGGEGQPQTQAAVFSRYALFGQPLQQAITAPRWLLGRTWGDTDTRLKLENRFDPALMDQLRSAGHDVEVLDEAFSDTLGHAGALVHRPDGVIEGAADPRADGLVATL